MKNKGIFQVLKKGDKYKIVYIEKGEVFYIFPSDFNRYDEAMDYKKNNKEELDNLVTQKKEAEQKKREKEEEERKAKEAAEKAKKEEKEKKKEERKEKAKSFWKNAWVRFISGFLAAVIFLTGGHFAGKGISNALKNKGSKNPSTSQTTSTGNNQGQSKYTYNYSGNVVTVNNEEYKELTTEEFENLTSLKIKELSDKGININSEDIIKYMMIVNCDKLAQDNRSLIDQILGEQDSNEVQQDAYKVISAMVMYNYNVWYTEGSTKNFIRVSDTIFDESAKNKAIEIERRVDEIALSVNDVEKMNVLVNDLLKDMLDPTNELYSLESGVGFVLQVVLEPIRGLYGMDLNENNLLNETNMDLIKYFVPYAGDEQKYIDNNWLTGHIQGINDILTNCPAKTRSRNN